jgi:hypothetical protein
MGTMFTKKFSDDYETVVIRDDEGREKKIAVYRGDYFELVLDEAGIRNFRRNSFLLLVAVAVFHISGGFINNQGMYQFYIVLPYVLAFFPLLYLIAGVLRLPKEKRKYRRDEIGLSFDRMKINSRVLLIFLGIGVLGEIMFIFFVSNSDQLLLECLYLALEMSTAAAVYFLIHLQRKIRVQPFVEQLQEKEI